MNSRVNPFPSGFICRTAFPAKRYDVGKGLTPRLGMNDRRSGSWVPDLTNQNRRNQHNEPIRIRSTGAGKCARTSYKWFGLSLSLVEKLARVLQTRPSVGKQNQSKREL